MNQHRQPGSQPVNRPFWNRHPRAILGVTAAALFVGVALVPVGPGAIAIESGQGVIREGVNYRQTIDLVEHCGTPLFMGKSQSPEFRISYEVARLLEHDTDRVQVTAGVRPGDRFNYRRNLFGFGAWVGDACPTDPANEQLYY